MSSQDGNACHDQRADGTAPERRRALALQPDRRSALRGLIGALGLAAFAPWRAEDAIAADEAVVLPVFQRYSSLASYSDIGTLDTDYQWPGTPAVRERHRFETAFRAPRNFYFRFDEDPNAGGDVFVIWCDGGDFQSWWKSTGVHEVYDGGRGALAFSLGSLPTKNANALIAPFLFPRALLKGLVTNLLDVEEKGEEIVAGRPCLKIAAAGRETGSTTENRPIGAWIDRESGLLRQVVTEAEAGSPEGLVDRARYALEPVADPDIPDERFSFAPPT